MQRRWIHVALSLALGALAAMVGCDELLPFVGFEPTGTPFNLDSDIEIISITGSDRHFSDSGFVTLDMRVRSTASSSVSDRLPAGLLFRSTATQVQHAVMLKDHTLEVDTSETLRILGTFCCNERWRTPDGDDELEIGPRTDHAGLQELAALVRDKDISDQTALRMVQQAVYQVTEGTGLTQVYRDSIAALPADGKR